MEDPTLAERRHEMILLTGATGLAGGHVAKALVRKGVPLRALVRDLGKAQALADLGIDLVEGDLGDSASLARAFQGVDKAFLLMANVEEQLDYETRYIDAAKAAGVSHLVKLSAIEAGAGHANLLKQYHGGSEDYLKASGLGYTILRGNVFMQYMLYFKPVIEATGAFYVPRANARMAMVDVRDIADVAAQVLTQDGHLGKTYTLTGPDTLTFGDVATAFSSLMGREVGCVEIPAEAYKEALLKTGQSDWTATAVTEEFVLMGDGGADNLTGDVAAVTGHAPRTFTQMLADADV